MSILVMIMLFWASVAEAESLIEKAKVLYNDMEYGQAVGTAGKVLSQPTSHPEEVREA